MPHQNRCETDETKAKRILASFLYAKITMFTTANMPNHKNRVKFMSNPSI
jgi:hypothetical protein